ncbi:ScbA/BarX family gamma-butyrolactone biosynthesis protein [Streptomyces hainanensis]|uniref:A-factor biosynthesis protein n=1 Tax=Streptomyces hainanensis TaxID=402648 RepID=A0A4R4TLS8_9ACTN|nr:ScbA/BarX family gamma-butyrolactone biosynthesis protein [Streptomyces hainanensis]TDC78867.1 A-factor biosynthesis protein [Streptomyces hainanensis]
MPNSGPPHAPTVPHTVRDLPVPDIGFHSTISRGRVHRVALAETFVTDIVPLAADLFACGAQLPRSHAYFGEGGHPPAHHDTLLLVEVVRQAVMAGAHEFHGIPEEDKFVLTHNRIAVTSLPALRVGPAPGNLTVNVRVVRTVLRDDVVRGLDFEAILLADGHPVAEAGMGMVYKTPASYQRLRDRGRAEVGLAPEGRPLGPLPPVAPDLVGRRDPANVVLSASRATGPAGVGAGLRVDQDHPSMFDHPQDHIPGMVMNEAFRQIALHAADAAHALHPGRGRLTRLDAVFARFGELDLPATATAVAGAPVTSGGLLTVPVTATLAQRDAPISTAEIELAYLRQGS